MNKIVELLNKFDITDIYLIRRLDTYQNLIYEIILDDDILYLKIFTNKDEKHICNTAVEIYKLLKGQVPVPEIIAYDKTDYALGYPFILTKKIEGIPLREAKKSMTEHDLMVFYRNFGETLAKIHSNDFKEFGGIISTTKVGELMRLKKCRLVSYFGPFQTWKDLHHRIIQTRLACLVGSDFSNEMSMIAKYFKENNHQIDFKVTPRLLHMDLSQNNVFVKNNKVSGILDFEDSFVGHNEEELMRIESDNFADEQKYYKPFFEGYTRHIKLDENYEERRIFYYISRLLMHMINLHKYGRSYKPNLEEEIVEVKREIRKIVSGNSVNLRFRKYQTKDV